jgi:hypothetical protein
MFCLPSLMLCGTGCHVTNERAIVGTYKAETSCVTINLTLGSDHSFAQKVKTTSGETRELTGKWSIDRWKAEPNPITTVDFDTFLDFSKDYHGVGGPGGTGFRPERLPQGITMGPIIVKCPDSDHEVNYVKQ